jgi:signal transduction histidine kinase
MPKDPIVVPIDSLPVPLAVVSAEGIIEACNDAYAVQFGVAPERIAGTRLASMALEPASAIMDYLSACTRSEHPVSASFTLQRRAAPLPCRIDGMSAPSEPDAPPSSVLLSFQPHEADRRRDEFLAWLAHELRNPLAPIRMGTELLRRSEHLTPELRAVSLILERQVRQLIHLVDDLLDASRITSGQVQLHREDIDLRALLTALIESYRSLFDGARQEVSFSAGTDPLCVNGDRVRLTQVFSNILHNAAKYTPPTGRIHIELRREAGHVIVSVRDSGIGIPPEMHDRIFDLFVQRGKAFERTDRGLGMGLTVASRLVKLHGGSIEARSEGLQTGSEFIVTLPAIKPPARPREQGPRESSERSRSRRVLIADDNHDAAVSLGILLQAMGHETRIAYDGQEAVEAAEVYRPDFVLLDLGMPNLDGYQAARRIASRPWAGSTLLVAVTGWGQEADRQRSREAGFHRHLVKPVAPESLRQLLGEERPLH